MQSYAVVLKKISKSSFSGVQKIPFAKWKSSWLFMIFAENSIMNKYNHFEYTHWLSDTDNQYLPVLPNLVFFSGCIDLSHKPIELVPEIYNRLKIKSLKIQWNHGQIECWLMYYLIFCSATHFLANKQILNQCQVYGFEIFKKPQRFSRKAHYKSLKGRKKKICQLNFTKKWACLNFENDDVRTDKSWKNLVFVIHVQFFFLYDSY